MSTPQLIDTFGRAHDYLRISLTERCNLRCFYCMPEEGIPLRDKAEFMTQEEILKIAGIFVKLGVKKIRLTGGEPLVKKNISGVLQGLSQMPVSLAITTNGILVDKYIEELKACGVKNMNVSLDTLNKEKFFQIARRDYFTQVLQNIDLLVSEGFQVKLNTVLIRGVNEEEIIPFIQLSKQANLHVRFIEFMPFDGNNWSREKSISEAELLEKAQTYFGKSEVVRLQDAPHDTTHNYRINGFAGTFGSISSVTNPFCDTCNRIRLTADGKLKNCLFSAAETDLLTPLRNGADITPLIIDSVLQKKKSRAGLPAFNSSNIHEAAYKNRSMIAIGG